MVIFKSRYLWLRIIFYGELKSGLIFILFLFKIVTPISLHTGGLKHEKDDIKPQKAVFRTKLLFPLNLKISLGKNYSITVQWIFLNFCIYLRYVTHQNMTGSDFWSFFLQICGIPSALIFFVSDNMLVIAKKTVVE